MMRIVPAIYDKETLLLSGERLDESRFAELMAWLIEENWHIAHLRNTTLANTSANIPYVG
jgi:hypothetical protein